MTDTIIPLPRPDRAAFETLLPWYACGGLETDEREAVRTHIADCAHCRAELADERRLASAMAELAVDSAPDVEDGWAAIKRQLDSGDDQEPVAATARAGRRRSNGGRRVAQSRTHQGWMGWAIAAQFAAIVLLGGLAWREAPPAQLYHTLSSAPPPAAANIVVVFRPETPEKDIRAMLRAAGARLVDGPTSTDAYLLHVAPTERKAALQVLRDHAAIVVVQPVDED